MALLKEHTIKGIDANYWRIVDVKKNYDAANVIHFILALYKDKATRDQDEKSFLIKEKRFLSIDDLDGNIREQIYTKLKTEFVSNPMFNWTDFRDSQTI
jgi:hypothetical protein